jgi:hypothetical protein
LFNVSKITAWAAAAAETTQRRAAAELLFASVGKLTMPTIGLALGLALAPVANALPTPVPQGAECDPNYSGPCVPIASDVDCAGGSGNGPKYVSGPVYVVGKDIYDLDRDGDGVGCDK